MCSLISVCLSSHGYRSMVHMRSKEGVGESPRPVLDLCARRTPWPSIPLRYDSTLALNVVGDGPDVRPVAETRGALPWLKTKQKLGGED